MTQSRYWQFQQRPDAKITDDTFGFENRKLDELQEGQLLVRNLVISMDATNRLWLGEREELYMEPVKLGDSMKGFGLCQVVVSKSRLYQEGQLISGLTEWADYSVLDALLVQPFSYPSNLSMTEAFGVLSIAGPTAYHGMLNIGQPKPGETVVVTAASGAVGMLAGQIAKLSGCRVVGTAGSKEKCRYLSDELGFDAAINYRDEDFSSQLAKACPAGIDVQFENVGGAILDHCLSLMNNGGRVVICGLISMYNSDQNVPGPYMFHNSIMKRLKIEGFVILDHAAQFPLMQRYLLEWMDAGLLKFRVNLHEGLECAPEALRSLYNSQNDGKVLIKLTDPES